MVLFLGSRYWILDAGMVPSIFGLRCSIFDIYLDGKNKEYQIMNNECRNKNPFKAWYLIVKQ